MDNNQLTLFDEIDIEKSDRISVSFSDKMIDGDKSVAYKAATAFFDFTGISGGEYCGFEKYS